MMGTPSQQPADLQIECVPDRGEKTASRRTKYNNKQEDVPKPGLIA